MEMLKTTQSPNPITYPETNLFVPPHRIWNDLIFKIGFFLTLLSAFIFLLPELLPKTQNERYVGLFFVNYGLAVVHFFVLLFSGLLRFKRTITKNYTENVFLFLIMGLISAFALNRAIPVFEQSVTWLAVCLVALSVTLLLLCFRNQLPKMVLYGLYFLLGAGLVLYLYFSLYLLPFYPMGMLVAVALGLSLHFFVPTFSLFFTGLHLLRAARKDKWIGRAALAGMAVPVLVLGYFMISWATVKSQVSYALNAASMNQEALPNWIVVSRMLPPTAVAEKMMKTDLVYSTPRESSWSTFDLPGRSFDESRQHDPLVMIASFFLGKPELSVDEKISILEAMYDARHQALDRLWSGEDLQVAGVASNVRIFPEYRMAYTEKILSIKNNSDWVNDQQEAIFTFHLPEGGVVSSLSLWINGIEEKGILTTKAQADSAYKTIVGVESRDPSVVHWQEGNTVSVRVFPCTPKENRRFKIGVTAPLRKEKDRLIYQNIYFNGPSAEDAPETVKLNFTSDPGNLQSPFGFEQTSPGTYLTESTYRPYWELSFPNQQLSGKAFSFDGHNYQVQEYRKESEPFDAGAVYLDLNSAWTDEEFTDVWEVVKHKEVYAFQETPVRLTDENKSQIFNELKQHNFSLLPLYRIPDPEKALIISKSNPVSPNLKDLKSSAFARETVAALQRPAAIRLFNLGGVLSPYLKTLKELRVFNYDEGSIADLEGLLSRKEFVWPQEDGQTVVINNAGIKLTESTGETVTGAPDHLLRLFTYNHLMQQIGSHYFSNNFISEPLLAEAQKAYVISPVSSLVVLETQQDYDRFNIKDSQNSLRNASMHGAGSVPEPHEWFLIIMVVTVSAYLYFRPDPLAKIRP